jgi:hypothetical protein
VWHRIRAKKLLAFKKADKGGRRAGIQPKGRYKGFAEVIDASPELLRRFQNHDCDNDLYGSRKKGSLWAYLNRSFCRQNAGKGESISLLCLRNW